MTAEPGVTEKPVQKPVAATLIVRPVKGGRAEIATEAFLLFAPGLALEELEAVLRTSGFEENDATPLLSPVKPAEAQTVAAPEPAAPIVKPVLEVKAPVTPIAVYETIEFLDYDDEEDEFGSPEE